MRTTVTLDDEVSAAIDRMRQDEGIGLSEALNRLAKQGLATKISAETYVHHSVPLGLRVDITNIGDVLDLLDDEH